MLKDSLEAALESTLKVSDIAYVKNQADEYVFRKVVTTSRFTSVLILLDTKLNQDTVFIGEGFQMLSQMTGTFAKPVNIGRCMDDLSPYSHYPVEDYRTVYNLLLLKKENLWTLLGFTSCNKYTGFFRIFNDGTLHVCMSLEGQIFNSGDIINTESFVIMEGTEKEQLLDKFAKLIKKNHPPLKIKERPCAWCSWYSYYDHISEHDILENADKSGEFDFIDHIQIDDGYESHMGDWLEYSESFSNGLDGCIAKIAEKGKRPSIWVAPFIVSGESDIVKNHPDWLATDMDGNLIPAGYLTYGGWRDLPWYVQDFSNEEVVNHIHNIFNFFVKKLRIRYFKLDACYWGAIKGYLFRGNISRIENYRRGIRAILDAIGDDACLLGCNAPIWPSLGLFHTMRISDDTERNHHRTVQKAKETFNRLWMNNNLWINDPDALCIKDIDGQHIEPNDVHLQIATVLICGGIVTIGDRLGDYSHEDKELLRRIRDYTYYVKEVIPDEDFSTFTLNLKSKKERIKIYINWTGDNQTILIGQNSVNFMNNENLSSEYILPPADTLIVIEH